MAHALSEDELLALVDALADGEWHSGEALAAAAGISRAALAKRIDRLRDWQLAFETRHGLGYRLAEPIERLDAADLRAAAGSGVHVEVIATTDSTNAQLMRASDALDPQALFAEFQSAGRGRRGRSWQSPFGVNLYASLAWSFAAWPRQLSALPLAIGVACTRALDACGLPEVGIKWPNDLWVDGRKLGGILIEQRGETGGACRVVIGVGLNVAMSEALAAAIDQPWTSFNAACRARGREPVSRNALAQALLAQLVAAVPRFAAEGFDAFAAEWSRRDLTRERPVRIDSGGKLIEGVARGVDGEGALIVETPQQRHVLHSGDVSLRLERDA